MINLIKIKGLVPSLCIAGTLFVAASCSESKTADSKEIAQLKNIAKLDTDDKAILVVENDNDAKFLMDVAEMQMEEISLGKLAQQKGNSVHVKELGKMMEATHSKSLTELKALAQSKSVSIPGSVTEDTKDAYDKLDDKTGNDFGKTYSDMMVDHHEDAIELFERVSEKSKDLEIKTWATEKLPALRTHLKEAQACKKECDEVKS